MKKILSIFLLCPGLCLALDSEASAIQDITIDTQQEIAHIEPSVQQETKPAEAVVQEVIKEIKEELAAQRKRRIRPWMKGSIASLLKKHGEKPVLNAVRACEKMWKLSDSLRISKGKLFKIALYIETKLRPQIKKGTYYFQKSRTKLARAIEYDRKSKLIFIHLNGHVGKGCHKKVTRSLIYHKIRPELVANLTFIDTNKGELDIIKKLKAQTGIAATYAITKHKEGKKKVQCVMQKFYNGGSLFGYLYSPGRLSKDEIMLVSRDLVEGLENIHKHNVIHRDLHGGNFILDLKEDPKTKKKRYFAVITDFGQAKSPEEAKIRAPHLQVPHRWNPPEAFWRKKSGIDPKASEVYSLGLSLYHLYFGSVPEWARKEDFDHMPKSKNQKVIFRKKLTDRLRKQLAVRKRGLGNDVHDQFAKIILSMCHPNQYQRPSTHEVRQKIENLLQIQGNY